MIMRSIEEQDIKYLEEDREEGDININFNIDFKKRDK